MAVKTRQPTIEELVKRIDRLETLVRKTSASPGLSSHPAARRLSDMMERQSIAEERRAREVLKRTFGIISKARGRQMLRELERNRSSWK